LLNHEDIEQLRSLVLSDSNTVLVDDDSLHLIAARLPRLHPQCPGSLALLRLHRPCSGAIRHFGSSDRSAPRCAGTRGGQGWTPPRR
jgi:hypothetical protein